MNDAIERDVFRRMSIRPLEEHRFSVHQKQPDDVVLPAARPRFTCWECHKSMENEHVVLWHQWEHTKEYNGFLDGKRLADLPPFNFYFPCPFSTCNLKFYHLIDAKFHYLTAHQSCKFTCCCGAHFGTYEAALTHLSIVDMSHFLSPCYQCPCHAKLFSTRDEYTAHLQSRDFKCADPTCHMFFGSNDSAVSHLFNRHYKHVRIGFRKVLLAYELFVKYGERLNERRDGRFHCGHCYRSFYTQARMEQHQRAAKCNEVPENAFSLLIPCRCGHQFVYCTRQRDLLLKHLTPFREVLEHLAREAPYSNMDDLCEVYHAMSRAIYDVNQRLVGEKYAHYQKGDPFEHHELTANQMAKLLLGVVEYFLATM